MSLKTAKGEVTMVFERIKDILSEQLDVEPEEITEQPNIIEDLGADSLDVVEMLMSLEDEFNVIITDEKVHEFTTVGDVVKFVEGLIK